MSALELGSLLADASQCGAYFVDARDREALVEAGRTLRYEVRPIDLRTCEDAAAAIREIAEACAFPDWFGGNLDALADCLCDLSWLPAEGYVLLLEHAGDWRTQDQDGFDSVLDVLNEAGERWAEDRIPFWAFLPLSARELETMGEAETRDA